MQIPEEEKKSRPSEIPNMTAISDMTWGGEHKASLNTKLVFYNFLFFHP